MLLIHKIGEFIKRLWSWLPILWRDRDWDYLCLFGILRFKLKSMEEYFGSEKSIGVHANRHAKKMKICRILIDRICKDSYSCWNVHNKKWGDINISWKDTEDPDLCELILTRDKVLTKEDEIQEGKEFRRCSEHANMLLKQDLEYLFKILNKHILTWWD